MIVDTSFSKPPIKAKRIFIYKYTSLNYNTAGRVRQIDDGMLKRFSGMLSVPMELPFITSVPVLAAICAPVRVDLS